MTEQNTGENTEVQENGQTPENQETENQEQEQQTGDQETENQGEGTQGEESQEDPKEHNRKGYEFRKQKEAEQINKEEFEEYKQKVAAMEAENEKLKFQQDYPEISDELYQSLEAQAKGMGKDKEELVKNDPYWQNVLETERAKGRVEGAEPAPSTKSGTAGSNKSPWEMSQDEFNQKKEEVKSQQ